jgi:hypothetical protein
MVLNVAGIIVLIWGCAYPWPYFACALATVGLPMAAVGSVILSQGRVTLSMDDREDNDRPAVWYAFLSAPFGRMLGSMFGRLTGSWFDSHLVNSLDGLWIALGIGSALAAVALASDTSLRRNVRKNGFMLIAFFVCGWFCGELGNSAFDRSDATVYRTTVERKWVSRVRLTYYNLRLRPWGPVQSSEVDVPERLYRELEVNGPICVVAREGALRAHWFSVSRCPEAPKQP